MTGYIEFTNSSYLRTSSVLPVFPSKASRSIRMKPIFTNNAQVAYKPHSLAAGGIGTVRNSSMKSRKI